jgi:hypothetical protein
MIEYSDRGELPTDQDIRLFIHSLTQLRMHTNFLASHLPLL